MNLTLYRYFDDGEKTFGLLFYGNKFVADTLERPWMNNEHDVSCIPLGSYEIEHAIHKHGEVYEIHNVPNRTEIMIHTFNYAHQSKGCLGVGMKFKGQLIESRKTLDELISFVGKGKATLLIKSLMES